MKTGPLAGFLIVGARDNKHDFRIAADNVENLLGTIYIPNAKLVVEGKEEVARDSAWTVIVAQQVELKGDPTLVMNTDYNIGGVPVPVGRRRQVHGHPDRRIADRLSAAGWTSPKAGRGRRPAWPPR